MMMRINVTTLNTVDLVTKNVAKKREVLIMMMMRINVNTLNTVDLVTKNVAKKREVLIMMMMRINVTTLNTVDLVTRLRMRRVIGQDQQDLHLQQKDCSHC